jgi:O-antigen ligase
MKAFRVFLFSWIVAQTFYFGIYGPDLLFLKQIRPHNVLFVFTLISFLLALIGGKTEPSRMEWPEKLLLLLGGILAASFFMGGAAFDQETSKKWLGTLMNFTFYPFSAYFFVRAFPYRREFLVSVLKVICFLGIYLAFTGVFEHYEPLHWLVWPGYIMDPSLGSHFERSRGPFMESVAMGRVLAMVFACWLVLRLEAGPFLQRVAIVCIPVTMASLYFTATRGPWIGFALICLMFLVFKTPVRRTMRLLTVCIVIAAVFGVTHKFSIGQNNLFLERQTTVTDRVVTWLVSGRMIEAHPLFGVGFGRFNKEWPNYYKEFQGFDFTGFDGSHNTILTMAAEVGLPTLAIYFLLMFFMWRRCSRVYQQLDPNLTLERTFVVMVMGILLLYLSTGWFSDLRWNALQNTLMFLLLGVVAAIKRDICDRSSLAQTDGNQSGTYCQEYLEELAVVYYPRN